jgi:pyruvate formate lyase activating enzyme
MKEAQFYKKIKKGIVQCELCPHYCTLGDNKLGKCRVRKDINGVLYALSYEQPVSIAIDPIEKKPLAHFLPKTYTFSIGMAGCNFRCLNCQNYDLSQKSAEELKVNPVKAKEIVEQAIKTRCPSISYTYSEPFVSYEYVMEIAKLARKAGLKNIAVTNGFINPEPLKEILKYMDAFNVDLKSINPKFYEQICGAKLAPVLEALKIIHKSGKHLEITNLLIPRNNDSDEEIKKLALWIKENLDEKVPLHFSAFHPCYNMKDISSTEPSTVIHAAEIAKKVGMKNVHTGNI